MTLYIEYILLDNLIMDFVILKLIENTYKFKFKKLCKVMSCVAGTLSSFLLPYLYDQILILNIYRFSIAIIMVLLLRKYKNFKQYITYLILFITYTFLLGGVSFGIIAMLKIDYTMSGVLFYSFEFPVSVFVLLIYFVVSFINKILKKTSKDFSLSKYLYSIKLFSNNSFVECVAFYDSGNRLQINGKGVNIISVDIFLKLFKNISLNKLLLRDIRGLGLRNAKYIEIEGLNKNGSYLSFCLEKMSVEGVEYKDVFIAVALKNFNKFDCILSSSIFEY